MFLGPPTLDDLPRYITYEDFTKYVNESLFDVQQTLLRDRLAQVIKEFLPWGELFLVKHLEFNQYEFILPGPGLPRNYSLISRIVDIPVERPAFDSNSSQFLKLAQEIASVLEEKNAQYGPAFSNAPKILEVLYPDGVPVSGYTNLLTIVRILDKLQRIATNNAEDSEDPWKDICGYALLSLAQSRQG